jgi:hemoglobin
MTRLLKTMRLLLVVMGLAACATMGPPEPGPPEPSLYKRLGGREGIALVVDDFVANVVSDDRINARFKLLKPPDVFRLKSNLSDFICAASGGPCSYVGADMKTAHQGMKVTEADWDATVEALVKALDKRQVPEREKRELLGLLGPIKNDIVGQ